MALEIKICGLNDEAAMDAALAAGADLVGLVYFPPSPRHVGIERAAALAARARGKARIVVLTVDADDTLLADLVEGVKPDLVQLHGRESPNQAIFVQQLTGLPVMKALSVAETSDLDAIETYRGHVGSILLDARAPHDATRPGGNGRAFDWSILTGFEAGLPYMLSGGLDADNVAEALALARPTGIDVSSGVETRPGVKDPERIATFVAAARRAASTAQKVTT